MSISVIEMKWGWSILYWHLVGNLVGRMVWVLNVWATGQILFLNILEFSLISLGKHYISLHSISIMKWKRAFGFWKLHMLLPRAVKLSICENEPFPSKASDQEESDSNLRRESDVQPGGIPLTVMLGLTLSSRTLFVWTFRSNTVTFHNIVMLSVWN